MVSTLKNYEVNEDGLRRDVYEKLRKFAKPYIHFFDVLVNYAHILLHNFRQQQTAWSSINLNMHLSKIFIDFLIFLPEYL